MDIEKAYESLSLKFKSGNDKPIARAVITTEEWEAIEKVIKMSFDWPELLKKHMDR